MSTRALKFLQMAGESLSHLEALRTIHLQQTKSVFSGISNRNITGCTRYSFSTTSSAWYGLEELIPKSPSLPVAPAEEETTTSSGETREKIAQQHQTSNATVVGTSFVCLHRLPNGSSDCSCVLLRSSLECWTTSEEVVGWSSFPLDISIQRKERIICWKAGMEEGRVSNATSYKIFKGKAVHE